MEVKKFLDKLFGTADCYEITIKNNGMLNIYVTDISKNILQENIDDLAIELHLEMDTKANKKRKIKHVSGVVLNLEQQKDLLDDITLPKGIAKITKS